MISLLEQKKSEVKKLPLRTLGLLVKKCLLLIRLSVTLKLFSICSSIGFHFVKNLFRLLWCLVYVSESSEGFMFYQTGSGRILNADDWTGSFKRNITQSIAFSIQSPRYINIYCNLDEKKNIHIFDG